MNAIILLARDPLVQRLGWVLIHFLWEGTAIGLALAILLPLLNRASSHLRYLLICAALLACAIAPVVTWAVLAPQDSNPSESPHATADNPDTGLFRSDQPSLIPTPGPPLQFPATGGDATPITSWRLLAMQILNQLLPYAVILWFAGVLILTARLAVGWAGLQRLRRSGAAISDQGFLRRGQPRLCHGLWRPFHSAHPAEARRLPIYSWPRLQRLDGNSR